MRISLCADSLLGGVGIKVEQLPEDEYRSMRC
jgi:hypothetical protein